MKPNSQGGSESRGLSYVDLILNCLASLRADIVAALNSTSLNGASYFDGNKA